MFGRHLCQGINIHSVDERLHVRVEYLRRLRLGADVGQIQTVAANHRRQELVGEHPLRVVRVCGVSCRQVRVSGRRCWIGRAATVLQKLLGATRLAVKPESASGFRVILVIGGLALPAGKAWTTPCFPRSRASPLPSNVGSLKSGLSSAKIWVTKTVSSEMLPVPLSVIAMAVGSAVQLARPRRGPG